MVFHGEGRKYQPAHQYGGVIGAEEESVQYPQQVFLRTVHKGEEWGVEGGDVPEPDSAVPQDSIECVVLRHEQFFDHRFAWLHYWQNDRYQKRPEGGASSWL